MHSSEPGLPDLHERLAPHARTAWLCKFVERRAPRRLSRIGGPAALRPGEPYPPCGSCGRPMPLFLQLAAAELPAEFAHVLGGGVLQLFYCTNPDLQGRLQARYECDSYLPFTSSKLLRIVPPHELVRPPADARHPGFPGYTIAGWRAVTDFPAYHEAQRLGVPISDEEAEGMCADGWPIAGDKLGGWPAWVQRIEYPDCPRCGVPMRFLFQLDSEYGLPFRFGDMGTGHVMQCPEHADELAFGWACG